jgi:hypothetical protein
MRSGLLSRLLLHPTLDDPAETLLAPAKEQFAPPDMKCRRRAAVFHNLITLETMTMSMAGIKQSIRVKCNLLPPIPEFMGRDAQIA